MSEQRPIIENSDRGLTINKQLGWTMAVTLACFVFWFGSELATMRNAYLSLAESRGQNRADIIAMEARVRTLENQAGRFEEKLSNILAVVSRIEQKIEVRP